MQWIAWDELLGGKKRRLHARQQIAQELWSRRTREAKSRISKEEFFAALIVLVKL